MCEYNLFIWNRFFLLFKCGKNDYFTRRRKYEKFSQSKCKKFIFNIRVKKKFSVCGFFGRYEKFRWSRNRKYKDGRTLWICTVGRDKKSKGMGTEAMCWDAEKSRRSCCRTYWTDRGTDICVVYDENNFSKRENHRICACTVGSGWNLWRRTGIICAKNGKWKILHCSEWIRRDGYAWNLWERRHIDIAYHGKWQYSKMGLWSK